MGEVDGTVTASTSTAPRSGLGRSLLDRFHAWEGDRTLPYTVAGITAILLLGAIIVPLSIPEPLPEPVSPEQQLAERYVTAFTAADAPAALADVAPPALTEVVATYGADGGVACTGTMVAAYGEVTGGAPAATPVDPAALAAVQLAHAIYCPERSEGFAKFVARREALAARAAG